MYCYDSQRQWNLIHDIYYRPTHDLGLPIITRRYMQKGCTISTHGYILDDKRLWSGSDTAKNNPDCVPWEAIQD